ncbi:MAG TPA: LLM class flavin-dependent oxidoreductase [Polyangiaceae bacterium]|nr:LLM class flavin-dependent oxidoreductase [Polyangiaceae bacterium]
MTIPLSVLDLAPIGEGSTIAQSFAQSCALAQLCERLGFRRFWLAEHHGMPGVASAATAILIGHVASHTTSIRVGAGGVMLPNHSPLVIAEQFGTLETLYPGRIDLGLGRAPGTDQLTSHALRRRSSMSPDDFPEDVVELRDYLDEPHADQLVRAVPGAGLRVPLWILGSSLFGAQVAAALGLPFAFASHFAPAQLMEALELYRSRFRPSEQLDRPYVMLGYNVFAADSDEEGQLLATTMQQAFVQLRSGRPTALRPPVPGYYESLGSSDRALLQSMLSCAAIGSAATVEQRVKEFIARTRPDELIVASMIHDPRARLRSYEILAQAMGLPAAG